MAQVNIASTLYTEVSRQVSQSTFADLRNGIGTNVGNQYSNSAQLGATEIPNQYSYITRPIFIFDTSVLPDDCIVTAASLSIRIYKYDGLGSPDLHIAGATTTSNTEIVASDYQKVGRTSFASKSYASIIDEDINSFDFNANGLAAISKTGFSKFSMQMSWDLLNNTTGLTWAEYEGTVFFIESLEESPPTLYTARLIIDYALAPTLSDTTLNSTTATSFNVSGNVTSDGDSTITERGFVYSLTPNPTTANSKKVSTGTTGSWSDTITGLAPSTQYYIRAYATNAAGTSYGSQLTATTSNSNPLQPSNLTPAGGLGVPTQTPLLSWKHNPGSANNSQAAYQVIIVRQSDSNVMYDSGKVTSTVQSMTVPSGASLAFGTAYQWRVRTWDTEDLVSPYSSNALFKPNQAPSVSVTSPIGTVPTSTPLVEWNYTDPESSPQLQYRVILYTTDAEIIHDSTIVSGTATSYQVPNGILFNNTDYEVGVIVWDSDQTFSDEAISAFRVEFISPSAPDVTANQTPRGFIELDIELNAPVLDGWYEDYMKVYRKVDGGQWNLIEGQLPIQVNILENFDTSDGWTVSDDASAPDVGVGKVGPNSLAIGTTAAGDGLYEKTVALGTWANRDRLQIWIYTIDSGVFDAIELRIGQNNSNYYQHIIESSDLTDNSWTCIEVQVDNLVPVGSPHRNTATYIALEIQGATGEIETGGLLIDQMRAITSIYEYTSYDTEVGRQYIYGVSTYNIQELVESSIAETSQFLITLSEYLTNTYLIPIDSPDEFIGAWMDGSFEPNWTHRTSTEYYMTKGARTPAVFVAGNEKYITGQAELRFFDEKFQGLGLTGAEALQAIKNYKPLIFKTWWGRTYLISIDGEISISRRPGIGWFATFSFTEIEQ